METEFEFLMLPITTKHFWHRPHWVKDGQDVTDAGLAMPCEFIEAADGDAEGEGHGGSCSSNGVLSRAPDSWRDRPGAPTAE
jgi:hypothetical protein